MRLACSRFHPCTLTGRERKFQKLELDCCVRSSPPSYLQPIRNICNPRAHWQRRARITQFSVHSGWYDDCAKYLWQQVNRIDQDQVINRPSIGNTSRFPLKSQTFQITALAL
jgi:hypothetical protein